MQMKLDEENRLKVTEAVIGALSPAALRARQAVVEAEQIAVVSKFRFMGDTIVATPFLERLRRLAPKARITMMTSPTGAVALAQCPYVDRVMALEMRDKSRWRHSRELLDLLRADRYGAAFLLNRSVHCALMVRLARIPVRIGYDNERRGPLLTLPIPYLFDRNEVDCHLDMARALGVAAPQSLPELWFTEGERQRARAILIEQGTNGAEPLLIGVQPGSNEPEIRQWGAERFARVADALEEKTGGRVLLIGGAAEQATALATERAMRHRPINLVGRLSLRDSLSVIGLCGLWVSNDTGLLHAAVAQRVPSVGLFGPNKVARWGYDVPRHRSLVVFPHCSRSVRDHATLRRCMDAIPEEQVLTTACQALHYPSPPDPLSHAVGEGEVDEVEGDF